MAEMEAKLDKQLEEILGKAVTGKDLEMLYGLDLKTLRQLNSGSNQKFDSFVKHFVIFRCNKHYRLALRFRESSEVISVEKNARQSSSKCKDQQDF